MLPLNCLKISAVEGGCLQCKVSYQLSHGICVRPILGCQRYEHVGNISICVHCQVGFNLANDTCLIMESSDPNCISVKDGTCAKCSNRFFFNSLKCVPVNPSCKSYEMQTGGCTSCY